MNKSTSKIKIKSRMEENFYKYNYTFNIYLKAS